MAHATHAATRMCHFRGRQVRGLRCSLGPPSLLYLVRETRYVGRVVPYHQVSSQST